MTAKNKQDHTVTRNITYFKRITKPTEMDNDDVHYETDYALRSNSDKDKDMTEEHRH